MPLPPSQGYFLLFSHRAIEQNKQDKTRKRGLKETPQISHDNYQNESTNTFIFMLPNTKSTLYSYFWNRATEFVASHTFFFIFWEKAELIFLRNNVNNIYFQRHIRRRIWRQKDPRVGGEKNQALHLWNFELNMKLWASSSSFVKWKFLLVDF